jgi:hypothetical protein
LTTFENDDALDWVYLLEKAQDMSIVEEALSLVLDGEEYLESPDCCTALAAAEVIAALHGSPSSFLPDEVTRWVSGKGEPEPALLSRAKRAVEAVLQASELKELWEETDEYEDWLEEVEGLLERLE